MAFAATACGLSDSVKEFVCSATGKTAAELSALDPGGEIALATELNGSAPSWSRDFKGSFRGRGNINVASRRLKTLAAADEYLDGLVENGARQF